MFQLELPNIKRKIIEQLEYLLSYDNLSTDEYLRGRADDCGYVKIDDLARHVKIKNLSSNPEIIFDTVKEQQDKFQVDMEGRRVKSASYIKSVSKDFLALRGPPENTPVNQIKQLFPDEIVKKIVRVDFMNNDLWYIYFQEDGLAQDAIKFVGEHASHFKDYAVTARVKTRKEYKEGAENGPGNMSHSLGRPPYYLRHESIPQGPRSTSNSQPPRPTSISSVGKNEHASLNSKFHPYDRVHVVTNGQGHGQGQGLQHQPQPQPPKQNQLCSPNQNSQLNRTENSDSFDTWSFTNSSEQSSFDSSTSNPAPTTVTVTAETNLTTKPVEFHPKKYFTTVQLKSAASAPSFVPRIASNPQNPAQVTAPISVLIANDGPGPENNVAVNDAATKSTMQQIPVTATNCGSNHIVGHSNQYQTSVYQFQNQNHNQNQNPRQFLPAEPVQVHSHQHGHGHGHGHPSPGGLGQGQLQYPLVQVPLQNCMPYTSVPVSGAMNANGDALTMAYHYQHQHPFYKIAPASTSPAEASLFPSCGNSNNANATTSDTTTSKELSNGNGHSQASLPPPYQHQHQHHELPLHSAYSTHHIPVAVPVPVPVPALALTPLPFASAGSGSGHGEYGGSSVNVNAKASELAASAPVPAFLYEDFSAGNVYYQEHTPSFYSYDPNYQHFVAFSGNGNTNTNSIYNTNDINININYDYANSSNPNALHTNSGRVSNSKYGRQNKKHPSPVPLSHELRGDDFHNRSTQINYPSKEASMRLSVLPGNNVTIASAPLSMPALGFYNPTTHCHNQHMHQHQHQHQHQHFHDVQYVVPQQIQDKRAASMNQRGRKYGNGTQFAVHNHNPKLSSSFSDSRAVRTNYNYNYGNGSGNGTDAGYSSPTNGEPRRPSQKSWRFQRRDYANSNQHSHNYYQHRQSNYSYQPGSLKKHWARPEPEPEPVNLSHEQEHKKLLKAQAQEYSYQDGDRDYDSSYKSEENVSAEGSVDLTKGPLEQQAQVEGQQAAFQYKISDQSDDGVKGQCKEVDGTVLSTSTNTSDNGFHEDGTTSTAEIELQLPFIPTNATMMPKDFNDSHSIGVDYLTLTKDHPFVAFPPKTAQDPSPSPTQSPLNLRTALSELSFLTLEVPSPNQDQAGIQIQEATDLLSQYNFQVESSIMIDDDEPLIQRNEETITFPARVEVERKDGMEKAPLPSNCQQLPLPLAGIARVPQALAYYFQEEREEQEGQVELEAPVSKTRTDVEDVSTRDNHFNDVTQHNNNNNNDYKVVSVSNSNSKTPLAIKERKKKNKSKRKKGLAAKAASVKESGTIKNETEGVIMATAGAGCFNDVEQKGANIVTEVNDYEQAKAKIEKLRPSVEQRVVGEPSYGNDVRETELEAKANAKANVSSDVLLNPSQVMIQVELELPREPEPEPVVDVAPVSEDQATKENLKIDFTPFVEVKKMSYAAVAKISSAVAAGIYDAGKRDTLRVTQVSQTVPGENKVDLERMTDGVDRLSLATPAGGVSRNSPEITSHPGPNQMHNPGPRYGNTGHSGSTGRGGYYGSGKYNNNGGRGGFGFGNGRYRK